ncbi:hypothetical protein Noda2021_06030 [Candidatus Dependentiae bacterium Noda2021]|nr:hypothetical protein Noda2021_06030 [Candidatus Dependentiae bacterium Noda2021]
MKYAYVILSLMCAHQSAFSMIRVVIDSVSNMTDEAIKIKYGSRKILLQPNTAVDKKLFFDLPESEQIKVRFEKNDNSIAQLKAGLEIEKTGQQGIFNASLYRRIGDKVELLVKVNHIYATQSLLQEYEQWIFHVKILLSGKELENSTMEIRQEVLERR